MYVVAKFKRFQAVHVVKTQEGSELPIGGCDSAQGNSSLCLTCQAGVIPLDGKTKWHATPAARTEVRRSCQRVQDINCKSIVH